VAPSTTNMPRHGACIPSPSPSPSSLHTAMWLLCEEQLLAPFLPATSLLRLSETAAWLVAFRAQIPSLVLRGPSLFPALSLLTPQRRLGRLRLISVPRAGEVMLAIRGRAARSLSALEVVGEGTCADVMEAVKAQACPALTRLTIRDGSVPPLLEALKAGACSRLVHLDLQVRDSPEIHRGQRWWHRGRCTCIKAADDLVC
jgi:hypothetical protein